MKNKSVIKAIKIIIILMALAIIIHLAMNIEDFIQGFRDGFNAR